MISRREWLGTSLGAGAALALSPELLRALQAIQPGGKLIQRAIPSTGEMLPAVGLSFSNHVSCANPAALREVFKAFVEGGGRYLDAMHGNGASEQFHATLATELGVQDKMFWSARGVLAPAPGGGPGAPTPPGPEAVKTAIDAWLSRAKISRMDSMMLGVAANPAMFAAMQAEKKAGRLRYVGVQTIVVKNQSAQLEKLMRDEPIDFIGVDYDISNRHVEETILPLAMERKIGVIAYFPFSNNTGVSCGTVSRNLFARVGNRPLPEWAGEFDAKTWSHFFTKYVLGHPAITVARVGTTKASHMLDNMGGGVGRLPNQAMRERMAAFIDALPALPPLPQNPAQVPGISLSAAILDRYVGEYKAASGFTATFRRDGDRLWVKPGTNPEAPLNARTETRFQDPRGPFFDFQLDAQGKVTGAVLEQQGPQGPQRMQLERK